MEGVEGLGREHSRKRPEFASHSTAAELLAVIDASIRIYIRLCNVTTVIGSCREVPSWICFLGCQP